MRPPWFSNPATVCAQPQINLDRDVADQPRAGLTHRLQVDQAKARQALLAELVAAAQQLVATADGEHDRAVANRIGERPSLALDHVGGDGSLVAILATAEIDEVVLARVEALSGSGSRVLEVDPAPLAAALQEEDVAAVGVDVHLLRVESEQAQLHQDPFWSTTTVEPTWMSVAGISRRSTGRRPQSGRLPLELRRREGGDPHGVRLLAQLAVWRNRLTQAMDDDFTRSHGGLDGQARVDPTVDLPHVGERRRRAIGLGHALEDGCGETAAGAQRSGDTTQAGEALGSVGQQLQHLGRGDDQPHLLAEREVARVGDHRRQWQRGAPLAQRGDQLGVAVEPDCREATPGQVHDDAAGPTAKLQYRPAGVPGQLLPEDQIGAVAAALDVVPDRSGSHRQNSFA